jgi:hypothetical protein
MNRTQKTYRRLAVAWIALWLSGWLPRVSQADSPLEGTKPAQWRVIWTADPATAATVSWSTAQQARKYSIRYREKDSGEKEATVAPERGRFMNATAELYYYHARLSELKPSTAYEFQIESDGEKSPKLFFETAPADERPLSILQGGDSRSDREERRRVNQMMSKMVTDSFENNEPVDNIIALAHGGDYVANGKNLEQWSMWLSDHELTVGKDGRMLPIIPARGNHDKSELFNEVFGFPDQDTNFYAVNLGLQVRLITLNTEISTAGEQANWLNDELKNSRPEHRWLIAQYHRPAYPAVKSPSAALQSWVPLFEKYNMDLVCEADGHNIKRTIPIRANVKDETGVVYVGEGGLGVAQRTPKVDRWYLQPPGMADAASHVFVLTFDAKQLSGKCVRLDGSIADHFVLMPRDHKAPANLEKKSTKNSPDPSAVD